jgi:hypothetical protein
MQWAMRYTVRTKGNFVKRTLPQKTRADNRKFEWQDFLCLSASRSNTYYASSITNFEIEKQCEPVETCMRKTTHLALVDWFVAKNIPGAYKNTRVLRGGICHPWHCALATAHSGQFGNSCGQNPITLQLWQIKKKSFQQIY